MRLFILAIGSLTLGFAGCQSAGNNSMPAVDPFAMYGHTRIAPPSTGSYGVARNDPYYSSANEAAAAGGETQLAAASSQVIPATSLVDATKQPAHQVSQTGFQTPVTDNSTLQVASNEAPIRIVERVGPAAPNFNDLQGMAAIDATGGDAPRLASSTASLSHSQTSQPAQFQPVESATTIRVLPSNDDSDRPLPVRGLTPSGPSSPSTVPQSDPTPILPSATIQAGRFVPLEIATKRNSSPVGSSIAAASN